MLFNQKKERKNFLDRIKSGKKSLDFEYEQKKKLENSFKEEINFLKEKLQDAKESEERFISSISHEIRTPLTSIIGYSDLLLSSKIGYQEKDYVKHIEYSSNLLLSLVNDVLDVTRAENSTLEFDVSTVSINKLMSECMEVVKPNVENGVECEVILPSQNLEVLGDYVRLKQIFVNILRNSSKFTQSGFIRFFIKETHEQENELNIIFSIEDSGIGIDYDDQGTLFQPFKKGLNKEFNSSGLGMFVTKTLVELMGGTIIFKTSKQEGTTFLITLSLKKSLRGESKEIGIYNKSYEGIKILLVEDIDINRSMFKRMFENYFNADVSEATNGKEAIEEIKESSFDIVFMDLQMPVLDGLEATKEIRKFNQKVPILALTANITTIDKQLSFQVGMNGFIKKPLELDEVLKHFDRLNLKFTVKEASTYQKDKESKELKSFKEKAYARLRSVHKDEEIADELFLVAKTSIEDYLEKSMKFLQEQDIEQILKTLHTLKGIFWTYGLKEEGDLIASEEKRLKDYKKISSSLKESLINLREFVTHT